MERQVPIDFVDERLNKGLAKTGLRFTAQRRHIYGKLLEQGDHPSADEVFMRAKSDMPELSMATVYNTLDTLVKCGLVKQVNHERGPARYCSNMEKHHHFHCTSCNGVFDIQADAETGEPEIHMPTGFQVLQFEILFRGICPQCAATQDAEATA